VGEKEFMLSKQKLTKEDVLETAFSVVREEGIENLNARRLNSSIQPVFSFFENMADLKPGIFYRAEQYHAAQYINIDKEPSNIRGVPFLRFLMTRTVKPIMKICVKDGRRYTATRKLWMLCFLIYGSTPTVSRRC
jgi:hypothetical protein